MRKRIIFLLSIVIVISSPLRNAIADNPDQPLRVMTYNIHHGEGVDGKLDIERIASVINKAKVDLVALQEVDKGVKRTDRIDIPKQLAKFTGMNAIFEKNIDYQGGEYGNAILSRFKILHSTNLHYQMEREGEQRGLLQVKTQSCGRELIFMSTHLDYRGDDGERMANVKEIKTVLSGYNAPIILCGDFNDFPHSRVYSALTNFLADVWALAGKGNGYTFSSKEPRSRIDYIWVSKPKITIPVKTQVWPTQASDHSPLVAEFQWNQ